MARSLEVGDPLAQDRDKVADHVHDRLLHAEQIGVQIALTHAVADLAGQANVELILGDGGQLGAALVGGWVLGVEGHVGRLSGDRDLVDPFPGPLPVGAARRYDAHLGVGVALALLGPQVLGEGVFERGFAQALGSAEDRLDRALVLVDGVEAADQVAHQEPCDETGDQAR